MFYAAYLAYLKILDGLLLPLPAVLGGNLVLPAPTDVFADFNLKKKII